METALGQASRVLAESYRVAFIQHAPMEPRAAVAEWNGDRLTVWAGCDGPFRAQQILADGLGIPRDRVRVIVPDMGGGFGGKHTAEAAVEAARLARAAGKPVSVRWTREEEFTWAYCRPAALIECRGGLTAAGALVAWDFTSINPGGAALDTPYADPQRQGGLRRLGLSPAPGLLSVPGGHRQQLRPRVLHGRAGGRGRRRSPGVPAGSPREPAAPDRAREGGEGVRLGARGASR